MCTSACVRILCWVFFCARYTGFGSQNDPLVIWNDLHTSLGLTFLKCIKGRRISLEIKGRGAFQWDMSINSKHSMTHKNCFINVSYCLYYYSPSFDRIANPQAAPSSYSHQLEDMCSRPLVIQSCEGQGTFWWGKGKDQLNSVEWVWVGAHREKYDLV